jgi:hypothetical protein
MSRNNFRILGREAKQLGANTLLELFTCYIIWDIWFEDTWTNSGLVALLWSRAKPAWIADFTTL